MCFHCGIYWKRMPVRLLLFDARLTFGLLLTCLYGFKSNSGSGRV